MLQGRHQPMDDALRRGDMHGGGKRVIGRLAAVDVIIGMDRLLGSHLAAEDLDRPV
jgi:hypothetical protein